MSMDTLSGQLLVAAPDLTDPNFFQTVVLLVEHDAEGAFGLVLNRTTTVTVKAAWAQWSTDPCGIDGPLMSGGPVTSPLAALHTDPALAEREVVPGVFLAREGDLLAALVAAQAEPLRVYAGCSGWGPGQLEAELEAGAWGVTGATREFIFGDESSLWERVRRHMADIRLTGWIDARHVPRWAGEN